MLLGVGKRDVGRRGVVAHCSDPKGYSKQDERGQGYYLSQVSTLRKHTVNGKVN